MEVVMLYDPGPHSTYSQNFVQLSNLVISTIINSMIATDRSAIQTFSMLWVLDVNFKMINL